jgi:hypothetical protein
MNKQERDRFFEDWLRAYVEHLQSLRQGVRPRLVQVSNPKPPVSANRSNVFSLYDRNESDPPNA